MNKQVELIKKISTQEPNKYVAHEKVRSILKDLAQDVDFIPSVIKQNLSNKSFRYNVNPSFASIEFKVLETLPFGFVVNCFLPYGDQKKSKSAFCIHHHDDVLLTSMTAHGQGYHSIQFKDTFEVDAETLEAKLEVDRVFQHQFHELVFVDQYTPHVVFLPEKLSITLAYWTRTDVKRAKQKIDQANISFSNNPLKYIYHKLKRRLNKDDHRAFWFYVADGKVWATRRIQHERGSNDNFLRNVFCIMQQIGFQDDRFLIELRTQAKAENHETLIKWIDKFLAQETISHQLLAEHIHRPKMNFTQEDVLNACLNT